MANIVTTVIGRMYKLWKDLGAVGPGGETVHAEVGASVNVTSAGVEIGTAASPLYTAPGTGVAVKQDRPITVTNATGAGAMSVTTALTADFALNSVTVHLSAAPTTSENLIIKLDALDGGAYDTTLYLVNPSVGAVTDVLFQPDHPLLCENGDHIVVTFTNTDTRTYGVRIVTEAV